MNREIKFKGWEIDTKNFIKDGFSISQDGLCLYDDNENEYEIKNNYEIIQYIGINDINGKEIYEGDIIESKNGYGVVKFEAGHFFIESIKIYNNYCSILYWDTIIGNIYENPELLKGVD